MAAPADASAGAGADSARVTLRRVKAEDVKALTLSPIDDVTLAQAGTIMKDVRSGGEEKLIEIGVRFGDLKPGASMTSHEAAN